jgi:ferric-dicitrate binding protein FerR (iron transport regulator)
MNIKPDLEFLIVRYLNGESSPDNQLMIREWLDESEENRKTFYQIKDIWDTLHKKEDKSEAGLLRFYRQQAHENSSKTKVLHLWRTIASVASVLLLFFVSIYVVDKQSNKIADFPSEIAKVTIKVPYGSRSMVNLADGSVVMLNSGTELTYPEKFAAGKREVSLIGEAFFTVHSDVSNPFVVKTGDFEVQATGTQFNICSYPDDSFATVTLAEGKVNVGFEGARYVPVNPSQKLNFARTGHQYTVDVTEVRYDIA